MSETAHVIFSHVIVMEMIRQDKLLSQLFISIKPSDALKPSVCIIQEIGLAVVTGLDLRPKHLANE